MHAGRRRAAGPSPADHEITRTSSNLTQDSSRLGVMTIWGHWFAIGTCWPLAKIGSNPARSSDDLPDPDAPVTTTRPPLATREANFTASSGEREAHIREVELLGVRLPDGSYGQRNPQAIAARETRVATRLRAVEHAYKTAAERDTTLTPPQPAPVPRPLSHAADHEIELE
jgi:hypothetical protein